MRLLLWVLLVALVSLLSSADAVSTTNSGKKVLQLNSDEEVTTRVLAADYENNSDKRLLRGEAMKTDPVNEEDDEERAILVRFKGSLQRLKEKLREIFSVERRYMKMVDEGKTPDSLYDEYLHAGTWAASRWKKRTFEDFEAWYKVKYPNWVSTVNVKKPKVKTTE